MEEGDYLNSIETYVTLLACICTYQIQPKYGSDLIDLIKIFEQQNVLLEKKTRNTPPPFQKKKLNIIVLKHEK